MPEPAATTPPPPPPAFLPPPRGRRALKVMVVLFLVSVFFNFTQLAAYRNYSSGNKPPFEKFHSGTLTSMSKIARIEIRGVIMPPFTERWIKAIDAAAEDNRVRGVLLVVDSPGGLVADSHQIYDRLRRLRDKKPVYVAMKRLAASGGYYVAMGGGPEAKIFAEPTTWTGSIGVIVPRYNLADLARTWGVKSEPLVTGPFKNSLDPLKELTPDEQAVWEKILADAFDRFVEVIDDGRGNLDPDQIRALATGQIYTATQALENGMIDSIGFEEDALAALQQKLELTSVRVIQYQQPSGLIDVVLGRSDAPDPATEAGALDPLARLWEANVPRAMYLFGWLPGLRQDAADR
ncbi:MAG: signal peptide peptidase SppA [Planctomyces sp.]|nr:signal peptide peptidase SppA [Planctomyces sp.]